MASLDDLAQQPPQTGPVTSTNFCGQGVQNSGAGNISVGRDLIIGAPGSGHDPAEDEQRRKDEQCLKDLRVTDPRDDKKRIESAKGGLLLDSYNWICHNPDFKKWKSDEESRVLWIKGDPGKGKTMLLCGIINELKSENSAENILFFFCQATDERINNDTAVLRGLMYLLMAEQQQELISHVRKKYDTTGKDLFQDNNAWFALSEIFNNILRDSRLKRTYLIIDALDECITGLSGLLQFIVHQSSITSNSSIKWIISSRNWQIIQDELNCLEREVKLSLELNKASVSAAVKSYIETKVKSLTQRRKYDVQVQEKVKEHLLSNANDTFLWVSLVCERLNNVHAAAVIKTLNNFPAGLNKLYGRMVEHIYQSDEDTIELCQSILALASVAFRPLTAKEVLSYVKIPGTSLNDIEKLEEVLGFCGSFLTLQESRVSFVHQSAKDYLMGEARMKIFPGGSISEQHRQTALWSLEAMDGVLRKDIYNLRDLGRLIEDIHPPNPDPLDLVHYACRYWIDHILEIEIGEIGGKEGKLLWDGGEVDVFLRKHLLHWLEALSLIGGESDGIAVLGDTIIKLTSLLEKIQKLASIPGAGLRDQSISKISDLILDAKRFVRSWSSVIQEAPLQVYASALVFSPMDSKVRKLFLGQEVGWAVGSPTMAASWGAFTHTLRVHTGVIIKASFSNDDARVLSAAKDGSIKIWNAVSGVCEKTLHIDAGSKVRVEQFAFIGDSLRTLSRWRDNDDGGDNGFREVQVWDFTSAYNVLQLILRRETSEDIKVVALSGDGKQAAAGLSKGKVDVWDIASGTSRQLLHKRYFGINSVAFSKDGTRLASAAYYEFKIWDTTKGDCLHTINRGTCAQINEIAVSHDGTRIASASDHIDIWNTATGSHLQKLHSRTAGIPVSSVAFSKDDRQLISASSTKIRIWDVMSGKCLRTFFGSNDSASLECSYSITFSNNNTRILSATGSVINIWDLNSSKIPSIPTDGAVQSVVFSKNGTRVASGSAYGKIKIWDIHGICLQTLVGHTDGIDIIVFSNDDLWMASGSSDRTIKVWSIDGTCIWTLTGHSGSVTSVAFSNDGKWIASGSPGETVRIWSIHSGTCTQTIGSIYEWCSPIAFSSDGTLLALGSDLTTLVIWSLNGTCLRTLRGHADDITSIAVSTDGLRIATGSIEGKIKIWDTNGMCLKTLHVSRVLWNLMFDSSGSHLLCEAGAIPLNILSNVNGEQDVKVSVSEFYGYGLSRRWITWNGKNVLKVLLGEGDQIRCTSVRPDCIAVGCGSGRILIFKFSSSKFPLSDSPPPPHIVWPSFDTTRQEITCGAEAGPSNQLALLHHNTTEIDLASQPLQNGLTGINVGSDSFNPLEGEEQHEGSFLWSIYTVLKSFVGKR
ncbi:hypothetical protein TWF730_011148 [Orbilia blumenaviensis]|uniref:NACHT domain-containing protein n=1 Tax=Orbilia blumenaviensis TaxID=1796055 RepID=A0AAV9UL10_9PEZI